MNLYKLLISLLSLAVIIYIAWLAVRNRDKRFFLQRLGFGYKYNFNNNKNTIWIHAASVGEVNAASPLIKKLSEHNNILLTSNTPSSAQRAEKLFGNDISHSYCPVDWQWAISKFITANKPGQLFIIETELWPNLFTICRARGISVSIINGRLSEKTIHAASWLKKRYAECLQSSKIILSRSEEDTQRFIALGANSEKVKTIGNIKFYQQHSVKTIEAFTTLKPYVLAASTRDDEEKILVKAWQASEHSNRLLVIVPRHPQRLNEIINQLKEFKLNIAVRSKKENITEQTDLYIADTFGELLSFIKGANFIIMGGSFVNKGGQNILEVAQLGKAVIFGPYMDNFREEAKLFIEYKAGIQPENPANLTEILNNLFENPETIKQYQLNSEKLISQQQGIFENYMQELKNIYPALL